MNPPLVDVGVHHQPKGVSDRVAYGFVKALRFLAHTPCPPHVTLEPNWKQAA